MSQLARLKTTTKNLKRIWDPKQTKGKKIKYMGLTIDRLTKTVTEDMCIKILFSPRGCIITHCETV